MLSIVKPTFTYTMTNEPDEDYRKYIARKVREGAPTWTADINPEGLPLDISLDDEYGDVVAGIAAQTSHDCLYIEWLWISNGLRRHGIARQLVQMAEEEALRRGCTRVRVCTSALADFYEHLGYEVTGKLQQFPQGTTRYWLNKNLATAIAAVDAPA